MNTKPKAADKNKTLGKSDPELLALVKMLLGDPAHQDNPRREPLIRLLAHSETQRRRVERLIKISDRYQNVTVRATPSCSRCNNQATAARGASIVLI